MSDPETLAVYAAKVDEYAALTDAANQHDPLLTAFIADLPEGAHVLDLGCGPGQAAARMAEAGCRATATDAVPGMIALAAAHPGVTARLATFDDLTEVATYDGIWANFSLLHAPRADMPRHLAALHRALKPKGLLHIALKSGEGEKRDPIGRRYTYYTDAALTGLLTQAGFTVTARATGREKGLDGVPADWIALRAYG